MFSLVKHNRYGRVMQMTVLLDRIDKAHRLLNGQNSSSERFCTIHYYQDENIECWSPELTLRKCYRLRCFWDLQQNQVKHYSEEWQTKTAQPEMHVSQEASFHNITFFHHLLYQKQSAKI